MIPPLSTVPPIQLAVPLNTCPVHRELRRSESAPGALASLATEARATSADDDFEPMDTTAPAGATTTCFSETSAAYLQLRNVDKRSLFEALDRTAAAALRGPLTEAETADFATACGNILALEMQAGELAGRYALAFEEMKKRQEDGAAPTGKIDWLAGGTKDVSTPDAVSAVGRLVATERMTKATQVAVFGGELDMIFAADLPDREKVIVARAAQRFLNAATLVLNSPLGGPALANLQALEALVGRGDRFPAAIPTDVKWSAPSVRLLLKGRLEALVERILAPAGTPGDLSPPAVEALRQSCANILGIIDAQLVFEVPPAWLALAGR